MHFRKQGSRRERELDYDDFKTRIAAGEIQPLDEVRDAYLTSNEWRTVNNLRLFHRLAPEEHEQGAVLSGDIARREREKVRRENYRERFDFIAGENSRLHSEQVRARLEELASIQDRDESTRGISMLVMKPMGPGSGAVSTALILYRDQSIEVSLHKAAVKSPGFKFDEIENLNSIKQRIQKAYGAIRDGMLYHHSLPDNPGQIGPRQASRLIQAYHEILSHL